MVKLAKAPARHKPGSCILLTDSARLPDPLAALRHLPRGASVILRHYDAPDRAALARRLMAECRRRHIRLLVAGDAHLAAAIGADGLHLPENQLRRGSRRWALWRKPGWRVTAAAHGAAAIFRAWAAGIDAVLLSPVFPTRSHPGAPTLGPLRFAALRRDAPIAVIALGGIDSVTVRRVPGVEIAGIGGILDIAKQGARGRTGRA